jgi:uncharacterized delta-60 repeat protein
MFGMSRDLLSGILFSVFLPCAIGANVVTTTRPAVFAGTNSFAGAGVVTFTEPTNAIAYFEWGLTTNYGNRTANQAVSGSSNATITASIALLNPSTVYHYRLAASNSAGLSLGANKSVRTAGVVGGWPQIYVGPEGLDDSAVAMTSDGAGDIYVVGYSQDDTASYGFLLIKYRPDGAEVWRARHDTTGGASDLPAAMVLDSKTNILVVGQADSANFVTVKFDRNGNKLWDALYRGTNGGLNWANSVGVDAADNIYVGGSSEHAGTGVRDFVVLKYATNGVGLWTNRFALSDTNLDACCIAVESNGNVTVTGATANNGSWATVKYDSAGTQLWARIFNGGAPAALTADASGNAYVTGKHQASDGTGANMATVKYGPSGNVLWAAFFNGGANSDDGGNMIALDLAGNVLVGGYTGGVLANGFVTATNWTVVKYTSTGQQLWGASYARNYLDRALSVARLRTDAAGNIYVAGASSSGADDFPIWKLNSNGSRVWATNETLAAGVQGIFARDLALDTGGVVYAMGYRRLIAPGNPNDYFTARYTTTSGPGAPIITSSPTGSNMLAGANVSLAVTATGTAPLVFQWRLNGNLIPSATNSTLSINNVQALNAGDYSVEVSNAFGRVTSPDARIWVLGITNQPNSQSAVIGSDVSFRVGAVGAPLGYQWRFNRVGLPGKTAALLSLPNVQAANAGDYDVVITNWFGAVTSTVARLTIYGQTRQDWVTYTNALGNLPLASLLRPVAADSAGNAYVAGLGVVFAPDRMELIKYNPFGTQLWQHLYIAADGLAYQRAYATDITLDAQENLVMTGIEHAPTLLPPYPGPHQTGYTRYRTFKYSPGGLPFFSSALDAPPIQPAGIPSDTSPPTVAVDLAGNSFIAAKTLVAKLATNGQTLWLSNHVFLGSPVLCTDSSGNIFVAGSATNTNGTIDYVVVKRSDAGSLLWSRTYDGTAGGTDTLTSLACDNAGNAIVTGTSASGSASNDIVTLKYAPDGTLLWSARFNGSAGGQDEGIVVKANSSGDVYVGGSTATTNGSKDFVLIKYFGSNGAPAWVRQVDGGNSANDELAAAAIDKLGNICIAGTSVASAQRGFKTVQFDVNGYQLWEAFYPAVGTIGVTGLAANSGNEVYLVGYYHPGNAIVRPLIKYAIDPTPIGGRFTSYHSSVTGDAEYAGLVVAGHSYSLESTTSPLPTTNWFSVSNITSLSGQIQLTLPVTNALRQFYQLRLVQ